METKIVKKQVFKTTPKYEDVTVFIAEDGTEFKYQKECEQHEKKLAAIKDGAYQFQEVSLDEEQTRAIIQLLFQPYDASDQSLIVWKKTNDENEISIANNYLHAKKFFNINSKQLLEQVEDLCLISSWTCGENSDYPQYYCKVIGLNYAMDEVDKLKNKLAELKLTSNIKFQKI